MAGISVKKKHCLSIYAFEAPRRFFDKKIHSRSRLRKESLVMILVEKSWIKALVLCRQCHSVCNEKFRYQGIFWPKCFAHFKSFSLRSFVYNKISFSIESFQPDLPSVVPWRMPPTSPAPLGSPVLAESLGLGRYCSASSKISHLCNFEAPMARP